MGTSGPGLLYVTGPFVFGFDVKAGTRLTLKLGSVQLVNTQSPAPMPVTGQFVLRHAQPVTLATFDTLVAPQQYVCRPRDKHKSTPTPRPKPGTTRSPNT